VSDLLETLSEGLTLDDGVSLSVAPLLQMTHASFPFASNFTVSGDVIDMACWTIESEWAGIFTLWSTLDAYNQTMKRRLCEAYLVGWWLADLFPTKTVGVQADGGMPLSSKSIGGVSVTRKDLEAQPALKQLESNAFGVKALSMIMSAPERMGLLGQQWSRGPAMRGVWPWSA